MPTDPNANHYDLVIDGHPCEAFDVIQATLTHDQWVGFLRGNVLKYSMRMGRKDGHEGDDARKMATYADLLAKDVD